MGKSIELERLFNLNNYENIRFLVKGAVDIPDGASEELAILLVMREYHGMDKIALHYKDESVFYGVHKDDIKDNRNLGEPIDKVDQKIRESNARIAQYYKDTKEKSK